MIEVASIAAVIGIMLAITRWLKSELKCSKSYARVHSKQRHALNLRHNYVSGPLSQSRSISWLGLE